jgi:general secretion pathway protein D
MQTIAYALIIAGLSSRSLRSRALNRKERKEKLRQAKKTLPLRLSSALILKRKREIKKRSIDTKGPGTSRNACMTSILDYNRCMRWAWLTLAISVTAITAFSADQPQNLPGIPCAQSDSSRPSFCAPSKKDLKEAKSSFSKALRLQKAKHNDEALGNFETATRLVPSNAEYATAAELTRQQMVSEFLRNGNTELLGGHDIEALADFRGAVHLDPQNDFAQQRLRDAVGEGIPKISGPPRVIEDAGETQVVPGTERHDFHFRGDSRQLLTQIANSYGITAQFDDSVVSRRVWFDIDQVDFYTAMRAAGDVTKTFWTPLSEKQITVALESAENHRQFDRMGLRTFYVPGVTAPTDLTDIVNALRNLFDIRFITPHAENGTIVVRAPQNTLNAATEFLETLGDSRPQVMVDVQIYQVSHNFTRNIGVQVPNQFNLFNIPAAALAGLAGQNIQQLVNQLISGGGINQANSTAISGLLSQLQSQASSIFSQPVATFGGGLTFEGLSLGTLTTQLSLNESWVKSLDHATLRTSQGNDATFKMGERYPVINASFAPVFNSPAISQVLQNNSFQAPFPSFTYEDLGLDIKAKPTVSGNSDIGMQLELQLRSLVGQSINGVPIIANQEYKGAITLKNGESAVVAGAVSQTDIRSLGGVPVFGIIPVVDNGSKEVDRDELLVVITPRVINHGDRNEDSEIWMTR